MTRRALVTGVSGQDGYFMAERLVAEGVKVIAPVRCADTARESCGALAAALEFVDFDFLQPGACSSLLESVAPDFIFNFAARSTGSGMYDNPEEIYRVNACFPMEILHTMLASPACRGASFVQASSAEMFGDNGNTRQDESACFRPRSPYGSAKLYVHNMIGIYRQTQGLHASSAILFNHESTRRPEAFVTRKIAVAAARIRHGLQDKLLLGNLEAQRDWGYAPEYVDAMYRMACASEPEDFVIATGALHPLTDVLDFAFTAVGLDYRAYVVVDRASARKAERAPHFGDPSLIGRRLGWRPGKPLREIIEEMVRAELEHLSGQPRAARFSGAGTEG